MISYRSFAVIFLIIYGYGQDITDFKTAFNRRLEIDQELTASRANVKNLTLSAKSEMALLPLELELATERLGRDEVELLAVQAFELGGIRSKRQDRVLAEKSIEKTYSQMREATIHHELSNYFTDAVFLAKLIKLAQQRLTASDSLIVWQEFRYRSGALSETELIRSKLEREQHEIQLDQFLVEKNNLQSVIAEYLKSDHRGIYLPQDYPSLPINSEIEGQLGQVDSSLTIRIGVGNVKVEQTELALTEIPFIPVLTFAGGIKHSPVDTSPIVGISVDLPLFSKTKTITDARRYRVKSAEHQLAATREAQTLDRIKWRHKWQSTSQQLSDLQTNILPLSTALQTRMGSEYRQSLRSYIEVIDAQHLLYDLQEQILLLEKQQATLLLELNLLIGEYFYVFD